MSFRHTSFRLKGLTALLLAAGNAGSLERSIVLDAQDYLRTAMPDRMHFHRSAEADSDE